jgi:hypothetical protein
MDAKLIKTLAILLALLSCSCSSTDPKQIVDKSMGLVTYNTLEIDATREQALLVFANTFSSNVKEESYEKSTIRKYFEQSHSNFDMNKVVYMLTSSDYAQAFFEEYGCYSKNNCSMASLDHFGTIITPSYDVGGTAAKLYGRFRLVMTVNEANKLEVSIVGHNLRVYLGTDCCNLLTLQPNEVLYAVMDAKLEQYRLLMYVQDALVRHNITSRQLNKDILSPISRGAKSRRAREKQQEH